MCIFGWHFLVCLTVERRVEALPCLTGFRSFFGMAHQGIEDYVILEISPPRPLSARREMLGYFSEVAESQSLGLYTISLWSASYPWFKLAIAILYPVCTISLNAKSLQKVSKRITQILCRTLFFVKTVKYWVYVLDLFVKNLNGCSDKLETWFVETLDPVWEKARKQQFYPGSRSLWICHLEYKNISKQYLYNLDLKKYLDSVFKDYVQLVLSISFTSFLHCSLFELQLILWQFNCRWLFQLGPKYKLKVKLYRR